MNHRKKNGESIANQTIFAPKNESWSWHDMFMLEKSENRSDEERNWNGVSTSPVDVSLVN